MTTDLRPWPAPGPYQRTCRHYRPDEGRTARLWNGRCALTHLLADHTLCAVGNPGHPSQPHRHRSIICLLYEPHTWEKPGADWPDADEWGAMVWRSIKTEGTK